jgi:hypothetical protein
MEDSSLKLNGYYSTDEETYYVSSSGAVFLVGSIETDGAVWEPCDTLPLEAEPSVFDPELAEEAERTRKIHGIE